MSSTQWPQGTIFPSGSAWQSASTAMYAGDYAKFSVTAGTTYQFSLCAEDGGATGYDSQLTLFNDAIPFVPVAFADQSCGSDARITWQATFTGLLRVQVNQYDCVTNTIFTTLRYRIVQSGLPPSNDQCAQAVNLNVGASCSPVNGTVSGATLSNPATTCNGQAEDDVWYKFTASNNNDVQVLISPAGLGFDPVIELFSGTSCNNLISFYCLDAGVDGEEEGVTITQLTTGQTIWIRVFDYYAVPANNPNFSICAFQSPAGVPGDECSTALPLNIPLTCSSPAGGSFSNFSPSQVPSSECQQGQKDVWYAFTITSATFYMDIDPAGLADPAFEYFSGSCGSLVSLGCENSYPAGVTEQVLFYNGVIGETIYLRIYDAGGNSASNQNYSICLYQQLGSTPPINDACNGAGILPVSTSCQGVTGTLQNAGLSAPASLCGGTNTDDVWYMIMPTDTAVIIQATPNGLIDGVMEVFTGTCGALTSRICVDKTVAGETEGIIITGTQPGQALYVRYYDYGSSTASNPTFSICAWWDAPACNITTPVISAGGPTTVCTGTVNLSTTPQQGVTYAWYRNGLLISGAGLNSYQASQGGAYTLVVSAGPGCTATSNAITVTLVQGPTVNLTAVGAATFCQGGSVLLTATNISGASYQWQNGPTIIQGASGNTYPATTTGQYSAIVTSSGCAATTNVVSVTVSPLPLAVANAAGSTSICQGVKVDLSATEVSGASYQWQSNGSPITGGNNQVFQAATSGLYTVKVTVGSCSATSAGIQVTVLSAPAAIISTGGATNICQGATVNLTSTAGSGNTYRWQRNGADIQGAAAASYLAGESGNYTLIITNTSNCSATSNQLTISVNPIPLAQITPGGPTTFCIGENVLLQASSGTGYHYQWTRNNQDLTGVVNNQILINETGLYAVGVTDLNGCKAVSQGLQITVAGVPASITLSGPAAICDGNTVQMQANSGFGLSYQWFKDNAPISEATLQNYAATQGGNYTIRITDPNNCSTTSPVQAISVGQNPQKPVVSVNGPLEFCQGEQSELSTPFVENYQFQWLNNNQAIEQATTRIFPVNQGGIYKVRVQNESGCQNASDALEIIVNPSPAVTFILLPDLVCEQAEPLLLHGGSPPGGVYSGLGVSEGAFSPAVTGAGVWPLYYVYTNPKGCMAADTTEVTVENCSTIEDRLGADIQVFPNPFDTYFVLKTEQQLESFVLFDMTGRIVTPEISFLSGGSMVVHTAHLAEGVYLIRLLKEGRMQVIRAVKGVR